MGEVAIQNVHPFHRELFGVEFVFAHNGDVPMFKGGKERSCCHMKSCTASSFVEGEVEDVQNDHCIHLRRRIFESDGDTDSEQIFCHILNALHEKFDSFPSLDDLYYTIHELCLEISQKQEGVILNFLLGFGEYMFAYSWPGSRPGSKTWNGLHYMLRDPYDSEGKGQVEGAMKGCCELGRTQVAVIATKPLGPESNLWIEMERGDLLLFRNGIVSKTFDARKATQ